MKEEYQELKSENEQLREQLSQLTDENTKFKQFLQNQQQLMINQQSIFEQQTELDKKRIKQLEQQNNVLLMRLSSATQSLASSGEATVPQAYEQTLKHLNNE